MNKKKIAVCLLLLVLLYLLFRKRGLAEFLIFTFSMVVHEGFHLITACLIGVRIDSLTPSFLGFKLQYETQAISPWRSVLLYLSGPLGNFLFAAVIFALSTVVYVPEAAFFIFYNLLFAVVNLIPAYPLDAARAIAALLSRPLGQVSSVKVVSYLSYLISLLMFLSGMYLFIFRTDNILLMVMAIFLMRSTQRELNNARMTYLMGLKI